MARTSFNAKDLGIEAITAWHEFPSGIAFGNRNESTSYSAYLEFTPIEVDGQTISKLTGQDLNVLNIFKKGLDLTENALGISDIPATSQSPGNATERKKTAKISDIKDKGTLADLKTIEPVKYNDDIGKLSNHRVFLYLPMTIQQMENVSVGPESLGVVGGTIASVIKGGDATLAGITGAGIRGAVGGVIDFVSGNASKELGSLIANKIASKVSTQAGLGVQSATRLQISPNTRSIFKQVNIREWSFSFQLIPTSEKESIEIENIIDFFRKEQLPEELGTGEISMAYKFPNLMQIKAVYFAKDEDITQTDRAPVLAQNIITRFLPAYLQSVDITYNTSGMSFYDNGKFHDATMNLKFIEYRPLNKRDIMIEREYLRKGDFERRA